MDKEKALSDFDSVVKSISKKDNVALLHDLDADGISSGAIFFNALKMLRGKEPDLVITQYYKTPNIFPDSLKLLEANRVDVLVVVDSSLDQNEKSILEAEKIVKKIIIIDHHKEYCLKRAKKTFVIKPNHFSSIEPSRYPCAKLVFDLFSRLVDLKEFSWIACVGLIGDNQMKQWESFMRQTEKENHTSIHELFRVVDVISGVEVICPEKLNDLLCFIANAKSPKEVIDSDFEKYFKILDGEAKRLLKEFDSKKEIFPEKELVWFEFSSEYNVKSELINRVSNNIYPNRAVVFVQFKGDGFASFSGRRQDFKVRLNDLFEKAVSGFEKAGAGGHIPAAAGRILEKDVPEFKKRVFELL